MQTQEGRGTLYNRRVLFFKNEKEQSKVELTHPYAYSSPGKLQRFLSATVPVAPLCPHDFHALVFHSPCRRHLSAPAPTKQSGDCVMLSMAILNSLLPYIGGNHSVDSETSPAARIMEQASLFILGVGYGLVNVILLSKTQKQNLNCL